MNAPPRRRVLVTYGWCRTAYSAAESLCRAGYDVFGCANSPASMVRFSRFTRGFDRVASPFRFPLRYVEDLVMVVRKRRIDVLLPVHEDALVIARHRDLFPKELIVACPSYEELVRALDKNEIADVALKVGIRVPRKIVPANADEAAESASGLGFPVIVKTRRGNSGKGVRLARSAEETRSAFEDFVDRFDLPPDRAPILQEYIEGDLFGTCFLAKNGELKACFAEKYLRWKDGKSGTSVLREPLEGAVLTEATKKMVRALGWTGIGHFDFVGDLEASRTFLLEMNPRFWGALNLAVGNGYDFPRGLVTMHETGEPEPESFVHRPERVKSLWILGEMIAAFSEFRRGDISALPRSFRRIFCPGEKMIYDDFRLSDPLPFLSEMVHYAMRFAGSGFKINPDEKEMMR